MKRTISILMLAALLLPGCSSMSKLAEGSLVGTGAGAALGAGVGALIGKDAKAAAIGAAIGGAVGAGTGAIIGKKMDQKAEELAALLARIKQGERSEEFEVKLADLRDGCYKASMRLRRIDTEEELFSISHEQARGFFERAVNIKKLSRDEKSFFASAFIRCAEIRDGLLKLTAVDIGKCAYIKRSFDID